MSDKFWREVTPSRFPHEREALAYLRSRLPDHEPWRVWTNFMFVADDGSMNEVDALVLSPVGLFLVEIKSHSGAVRGNQSTLYFDSPTFKKHIDHPRRLTNLKAKRLKSLLVRAARRQRNTVEIPRVEELVFLSHTAETHLTGPEAAHVTYRDDRIESAGVIAALTERKGAQLEGRGHTRLDKPIAKRISELLEAAEIAPQPARARIGDYQITGRLEDGASFNDFQGHHVNVPEVPYRIRRYYVPAGTDEERERFFAAARREFRLLSRINHSGILGVRAMPGDEYGPALVFEHDKRWVRLDRYLDEQGEKLSLSARLHLLRSIAEPVAYAHEKGVVHRALSPQAVLVEPAADGGVHKVKLMNWSTGSLASDGTTVGATLMRGTLHVEDYQDEPELVFLAPELRRDPGGRDWTLDVFSLGAIGYQIFAGTPPASDQDELAERVRDHGLDLGATVDAAPAALSKLIARATRAEVGARFQSVQDFLGAFDTVVEELDRSENEVDDPREAQRGSVFPDGTRVLNRLGSGATAIAFRVERGEGEATEAFVLKVAREVDRNERLAREAEVLRNLDHPHISRFAGFCTVGAFDGFLTKPANTETLRSRLRKDGALQLELLERFGDQLLDALGYLEARGISHRDLKPDNIAISDLDKKAPLSLVLFDFSLSDEPLDRIDVGTPQYADPFLADRLPKRWDLQAERYSAGVTLYEMATNTLPRWGDGKSDPRLVQSPIQLDGDPLPSGLRPQLLAFFERALAREPRERFDNAEAMRKAWGSAFRGAGAAPDSLEAAPRGAATREGEPRPETGDGLTSEPVPAIVQDVQVLGVQTPLTDLSFSTRARNALDRLELFTVQALLAVPPNHIFGQRGVGAKTRDELQAALRLLRPLFPEVSIGSPTAAEAGAEPEVYPVSEPSAEAQAPSDATGEADDPASGSSAETTVTPPATPPIPAVRASEVESELEAGELPRHVDGVLARLCVPGGCNKQRSLDILEHLLGLRTDLATAIAFPNQSRAAKQLSLNPGTVSQELAGFRDAWVKDEALAVVREDLARFLERNGGLAAPAELAEALLVERGSHAKTRDEQLHLAAALARAATEAEAARLDPEDTDQPGPRWTLRRREGITWLAATEDHVAWGTRLLESARRLASADPLPGRDLVESTLLDVARPPGLDPIAPARLARLVAAVDAGIDVSARGELYPDQLPAERALRLSLGTLTGAGQRHRLARRDPRFAEARVIEADEIQERVSSRYPRSAPLPPRPQLDTLLNEAGWSGRWDEDEQAFVLKAGDAQSVQTVDRTSYGTRSTPPQAPELAPEITEAARFAEEVSTIVANRRFAVVKAPLNGIERALELLAREQPTLEFVDLDARLIAILDQLLADKGVDPAMFDAAEAKGPADPAGWSRVLRIVDDAVTILRAELTTGDAPLCIRNVGLLARFGRWTPLDDLNGMAGGSAGRAAIVIVPGEITDPTFALFGQAIPALPSQRRAVSRAWLDGRHLQAS